MNRERPNLLFYGGASIFDVLESQKQKVKDAVAALNENYVLNVSEEDLVQSLIAEHTLHVPVIKEADIHVADHREASVDVSGDPMRMIMDRSRPFHVPGSTTIIAVPFDGDSGFFKVQPQTYNLNPPRADVVPDELHLSYTTVEPNPERIKMEYLQTVQQIKEHLTWLRSSVDQFHAQLESLSSKRCGIARRASSPMPAR
jgi:hypothetical protein